MTIVLSKEEEKILEHLYLKNDDRYNLHKAAEECQELALVLTQKLTKPDKVKEQEIIDEVGDVLIRLEILLRIFDKDKVAERVTYKLSKYNEYKDSERYKNI